MWSGVNGYLLILSMSPGGLVCASKGKGKRVFRGAVGNDGVAWNRASSVERRLLANVFHLLFSTTSATRNRLLSGWEWEREGER
uniref:Putative secreted peptide n=1 Tax=Anopheles braziliensis TaxID=58242 RepID=A0A2M3ZWR1_9DIPT